MRKLTGKNHVQHLAGMARGQQGWCQPHHSGSEALAGVGMGWWCQALCLLARQESWHGQSLPCTCTGHGGGHRRAQLRAGGPGSCPRGRNVPSWPRRAQGGCWGKGEGLQGGRGEATAAEGTRPESVLSYLTLSCPLLSCPVLSSPLLSCPILSSFVLSSPVLSSPARCSHRRMMEQG